MEENNKTTAKKRSWFDGLKAEYKRVIWPNKESIGKQTIAVVISSVILCALIAIIDAVISFGLGFIL